ncbi:MAG TPA: tetratricopeptide repeat protein [Patescibacteria group bacterium]|nr:tetratricopeptide repeat protein [Patescibacteria group bacterium]
MKSQFKGVFALQIILLLCLSLPLAAQYREYYLTGQIQDTRNQPLAGVAIELFETESSHTFSAKTGKDGKFKFAGLAHGIYQVTISKAGYESRSVEWKFDAPQEKMLRVEIPVILLASSQEVLQIEQNKQMKKDLEDATEKIRELDYDGALEILKRALESDAKNVNALYLTGLAFAKKKMYTEAKEALEQVTVLTPDFAPAHFQLGVCFQQEGEAEKALVQYREVMRLDPANLDNYFNATLILVQLNQPTEALANCQKILQERPDDPDVNEMAGQCQLQLGDYPKALACFEKALAFSKDEAKKKLLNELIAELRKSALPK